MNLKLFIPGTMLLMFFCFAIPVSGETLESIMKAHDDKIDKAKKSHEENIKKISQATIKRLDQLKKATTRSGNLQDAIAIQNEINKLEGKEPITTKNEDGGNIDAGVPIPPGENATTFNERTIRKALDKRYEDFYGMLIDQDFENAAKYLDPNTRKSVDSKIIEGHLRIISGALTIFQIKKGGVGIERVQFTDKFKEAKVTGKLRSALSGKWEENKDPTYWIYKKGEWYLGDKDTLEKLF